MNTFEELINAVQSDLTVGNESTLFDVATIKLAINRVYQKIGGMFRWPDTQDALKTSTQAGVEYYDYPDNWRPNSIWKITVDDVDYGNPLLFKDYLYEKENSLPSGLQRMWANQNQRYFLYPTPTMTGNLNISVWGYRIVDALELDGDITIFSYAMPEVNEAIVLEAEAILKTKGEIQQVLRRQYISGSELLNTEAQGIVAGAWAKISQEQSRLQRTTPAFNVIDFFPGGRNRNQITWNIGNFFVRD